MVRSKPPTEDDGQRRPSSRRGKQQGFPVVPLLLLGVLLVGALILARQIATQDKENAKPPLAQPADPEGLWDDIPEELPPRYGSRNGDDWDGATAVDLESNAAWNKGLRLGRDAAALQTDARIAQDAGDVELAQATRREALDLFNQALEATAILEEELVGEHGEKHPQARMVIKVRDKWFKEVSFLRKTTPR